MCVCVCVYIYILFVIKHNGDVSREKKVQFVFTETQVVYEVMWKNMVELDTQRMTT